MGNEYKRHDKLKQKIRNFIYIIYNIALSLNI